MSGARGYRGAVRDVASLLAAVRPASGRWAVQVLDADLVVGAGHLRQAARLAQRAWGRGRASARDLGLELLLYASGERQLEKALAKMGVTVRTTVLAVVVLSADAPPDANGAAGALDAAEAALARLGWRRDDAVLAPSVAKALRFGLSEAELAQADSGRAEDLVRERVALVDAVK